MKGVMRFGVLLILVLCVMGSLGYATAQQQQEQEGADALSFLGEVGRGLVKEGLEYAKKKGYGKKLKREVEKRVRRGVKKGVRKLKKLFKKRKGKKHGHKKRKSHHKSSGDEATTQSYGGHKYWNKCSLCKRGCRHTPYALRKACFLRCKQICYSK